MSVSECECESACDCVCVCVWAILQIKRTSVLPKKHSIFANMNRIPKKKKHMERPSFQAKIYRFVYEYRAFYAIFYAILC